ncbi:alpha/beta fold hydrolase [Novosphingobium rosa]|uniref:alpha/beta fold hydrolase n=1 Tax=Novosphingobium rosa TaxID=76978 RepID=UPI00082DD8EF|nr:alpha/beta hydrolase [Novosphingobium rosa]
MIFEWNGHAIHYQDEGSGPAIVLLHGLGGNTENWLHQRHFLSRTHRVLSLDMPGHGLSGGRTVAFADYPRAIAAMLDHAGVQQAVLCGLSKGARAGIAFAALHPERVSGMVIVNAFLHLEPADRAKRLSLYDLLLEKDGPQRWADRLLHLMAVEAYPAIVRGFHRSLERIDPLHIRRIFREQIDWDQRPDLADIACPVLVVKGSKDDFIPSYCPADILAGLRDGELTVMDAGHLPYLEAPAAFNRHLSAFLARIGTVSG